MIYEHCYPSLLQRGNLLLKRTRWTKWSQREGQQLRCLFLQELPSLALLTTRPRRTTFEQVK